MARKQYTLQDVAKALKVNGIEQNHKILSVPRGENQTL
jgi:hypothetical protein